jgi:hypothetical protein
MNIRRLLYAALAAALGQFYLAISLTSAAFAQSCEPTASAVNHICYDDTVSTSIHATNPCSCTASINTTDTVHHGGLIFTLEPGGESDQTLWPCSVYKDPASISIRYEFKCGKGDKNGQNTGATGSQGSESSAGAAVRSSAEGTNARTNKTVQDFIAYCRPENIGSTCRSDCSKYQNIYPSNALCVQMCAHRDASCAAANRGDANIASAEKGLWWEDYKAEDEMLKKRQHAESEASVKKTQQFMDNLRKEERKESQQRAARKAAQATTRPSQTSRPPAEADLGYPPGCRNKHAYDSCIGGPQGCSLGSRLACQPLCSDFCNDN